MMSKGFAFLASIAVLALIVESSPVSRQDSHEWDLLESWDKNYDNDYLGWLDNTQDGYYRSGYSERETNVEFFLYLIKALKSNDYDDKLYFNRLFKTFVTEVWLKRHRESSGYYNYRNYRGDGDVYDFNKYGGDVYDINKYGGDVYDISKYGGDIEENDYRKYRYGSYDVDDFRRSRSYDVDDFRKSRRYDVDWRDYGAGNRRGDWEDNYLNTYGGAREDRYVNNYLGGRKTYVTRRFSTDFRDDSNDRDVFFGRDDVYDRFDGDWGEESSKTLFLLYLKFKAHCDAQREVESLRRNKEDRARRQFALYSELLSFVETVRSQRDVLEKFSGLVDVNLQPRYTSFRNCYFRQECVGDDYRDLDVYKGFNWGYNLDMEGGQKYEEEGRRFALFLKLRRFANLIPSRNIALDNDIFSEWDCDRECGLSDNDDEDDEWKDKHPVLRYMAYLHKHLSERSRREFWEKDERDVDETNRKAIFFTLKAYKELREEREMEERRERLEQVFDHFVRFISFQEDVERTREDFYRFKKWQAVRENQLRVEEFSEYLRRVAAFKRFSSIKDGRRDNSYAVVEYGKKDFSKSYFGRLLSSTFGKDRYGH